MPNTTDMLDAMGGLTLKAKERLDSLIACIETTPDFFRAPFLSDGQAMQKLLKDLNDESIFTQEAGQRYKKAEELNQQVTDFFTRNAEVFQEYARALNVQSVEGKPQLLYLTNIFELHPELLSIMSDDVVFELVEKWRQKPPEQALLVGVKADHVRWVAGTEPEKAKQYGSIKVNPKALQRRQQRNEFLKRVHVAAHGRTEPPAELTPEQQRRRDRLFELQRQVDNTDRQPGLRVRNGRVPGF